MKPKKDPTEEIDKKEKSKVKEKKQKKVEYEGSRWGSLILLLLTILASLFFLVTGQR